MKEDICGYEIFHEDKNEDVDKLLTLYNDNPLKANVYFYHKGRDKFKIKRLVAFYRKDSIKIIYFERCYGISKNLRKYHSDKVSEKVILSNTGFYYIYGKKIQLLTYTRLCSFLNTAMINGGNRDSLIKKLLERYSWIRFVGENLHFNNVSFTTIVKKKLFNSNDLYRHIYKTPLKAAKILATFIRAKYNEDGIKIGKELCKSLINLENLREEMVTCNIFIDTTNMARMLNRKINCSWSLNRLKVEHDKWAKEITNILFESEDERELKIGEIFLAFEEFSGYRLLRTNREVFLEGMLQNHCVATYVSNIENGNCGIYHIDGYTLELGIAYSYNATAQDLLPSTLKLKQLKGNSNQNAPVEFYTSVNLLVLTFNERIKNGDAKFEVPVAADLELF